MRSIYARSGRKKVAGIRYAARPFPELVSNGRTLDEARHNAGEALELCLEVYQDEGRPIPASDAGPDQTISEVIPVRLARA
jgi:predicted RNase H-like HicB family nuclease